MDKKGEMIGMIIDIEWDMFTSVNKGEARAGCQEDRKTFSGMRSAQFDVWSGDALEFYLCDLQKARQDGRNLIEEKYIHMMKNTEPSHYNELLPRVTLPSDAALSLAHEISDALVEQTRVLFKDYPYVSSLGRPLYSTQDDSCISVETYQFCELLTYSEKTLPALKECIRALENEGISYARQVLENTVRFYGYDSLDSAEAASRRKRSFRIEDSHEGHPAWK